MSKIYNLYSNNIDKTWYNSSNILYSECYDLENSLKEVKVFFKNGGTYQYHEVNVNDYLLFREALSQGKALNKFLKKYEFSRLENSDISVINNELTNILNKKNNE